MLLKFKLIIDVYKKGEDFKMVLYKEIMSSLTGPKKICFWNVFFEVEKMKLLINLNNRKLTPTENVWIQTFSEQRDSLLLGFWKYESLKNVGCLI